VHDEILRFKLEAAAAQLQDREVGIAEVAARCGFTSAQYLHAVFRREFGCTPREYQGEGGPENPKRTHRTSNSV
jgi:LacI family transcriptional regulator